MKKLFFLIICLTGPYLFAQTMEQIAPMQPRTKAPALRLHAYATYAFDDHVDSYYSTTSYYEGTIKGGFEWGAGLEYLLTPAYGIEMRYLRLDSKSPITYYDNGVVNAEFDIASNYIMLGGNRYLVINPRFEPYAGLEIGMGIFSLENSETKETTTPVKFCWGLKAGVNIWASERIGIKLQGGLLSVVQSVGGSIYFGTGGGGAGVASFSTIYQWSLGGGLTFNLSN
jgi:hypothetical protein